MKRIGIAVLITALMLSFSGCPKLSRLLCHHNKLSVLDISACPLLTEAVSVATREVSSKLDCYIYEGDDGHGLYVDKPVEFVDLF